MAASGSARAAMAWIHWARPISAPSAVTMELSDMFCPLKGATLMPWRARRRQSPTTRVDLPASEVVPHTMRALPASRRNRGPWRGEPSNSPCPPSSVAPATMGDWVST